MKHDTIGAHAMTVDKTIPLSQRLILALDVPSSVIARATVEQLGDTVNFYKVGLELIAAGGYLDLVAWLKAQGKRVFADFKLFDVPNTVGAAVERLRGHDIDFVTVHGNDAMLEAACRAKGNRLKILAVTALTSLDEADMEDLGFHTGIRNLVLSRARRALEIGCDGVVSSGLEAEALRKKFGDHLLIVVPGIRPVANRLIDDQKRTMDLEEAFARGADYIVVGRPIREAPDPVQAARAFQQRIANVFR